ncbi:MAG: hypothetical protein ACSLFR_03995 [Solirubrobacteraceae bacterium]
MDLPAVVVQLAHGAALVAQHDAVGQRVQAAIDRLHRELNRVHAAHAAGGGSCALLSRSRQRE